MSKRRDDESDSDEFLAAMEGVTPLRPDPRGRSHAKTHPGPPVPAPAAAPADDLHAPDEDFAVPGVNREEIKKLKRGDLAAQGRLDLHGMTAAEACTRVGEFLEESRLRRHRCVCIVHGRGSHSDGNLPVLKPSVRAKLRKSPLVLAYVDAPRSDGGAVFVLLRKSWSTPRP